MSSETDATPGGDAGERRRRVLAAHAELFREALADEADRLAKLANVVEALARASDAEMLEPLAPWDDHAVGALRLERVRRRIELWWSHDDPAALARDALERQVHVLVVVDGFPVEMPIGADWASQLVLLDGRDLTLLLEGRWTLGQAVRFKHGEQAAHERFISLRVAPPIDLADQPESDFGPDEGDVLPSNVTDMPPPFSDDAVRRIDDPDDWDLDLGRRGDAEPAPITLPSNIEAHEISFAEAEAIEQADQRRLRRARFGLVMLAVVGLLMAVFITRCRQDADTASLAQAAATAVQAARIEFEAYQNRDGGRLRVVFDEALAQAIEVQIQTLRNLGQYAAGDVEYRVVDARLGDGGAAILLQELGTLETRSAENGETLRRVHVNRAIGYLLVQSVDDRWRVIQRGPVN